MIFAGESIYKSYGDLEVLKDVSFRVLPISSRSARMMIDEIRSAPILNGIRGQLPYDKKSLRRLLLVCAEMVEAYPDIIEMDLNPVIAYHDSVRIVDARIILGNDNSINGEMTKPS